MAILFGRDQLPVVISFFICGIISGILYDMLVIKRRILPAPAIVLFVDDFFFMLCNAVIVIFNAYSFNNGNLKWYEIPFMIIGFSIYKATLSVLFLKLVFTLIELINKAVRLIFQPVKSAVKFIFACCAGVFEKICLNLTVFLYKKRLTSCRRIL